MPRRLCGGRGARALSRRVDFSQAVTHWISLRRTRWRALWAQPNFSRCAACWAATHTWARAPPAVAWTSRFPRTAHRVQPAKQRHCCCSWSRWLGIRFGRRLRWSPAGPARHMLCLRSIRRQIMPVVGAGPGPATGAEWTRHATVCICMSPSRSLWLLTPDHAFSSEYEAPSPHRYSRCGREVPAVARSLARFGVVE
jgi:hypothetical protein